MISTFELLEPSWRRWRRWIGAGMLVLALHVGGAAASLWQWPEEEVVDDEPEGAMLLELAPMPIAPREERQDLAIGPQSEDSVAVAPTEEVKETKLEEELPPVEEAPLAPEPEVALEKVKPVEEKEEEEEKKPQEKVEATVASVAAAPPPIEASEVGEKAAAPHQGASHKPNQAVLSWQKALSLHLSKHKRYPGEARNRGIEGVATVAFSIDREGRVVTTRLVKGSGSAVLDNEALELLSRASPFPAPPDEMLDAALNFTQKFEFNIK